MSMFIRSRQQLSEARARPFVQQIGKTLVAIVIRSSSIDPFEARVLKFLHDRKISHMDLKPENLLLTSVDRPTLKVAGRTVSHSRVCLSHSTARLEDFGVAQHIDKRGSRSIRGTLLYMAPEILSSHPYDNRVDLWSVGIILYGTFRVRTRIHPLFFFTCRMSFRSNAISLLVGR